MKKKRIDIDLSRQSLRLYEGRTLLREYRTRRSRMTSVHSTRRLVRTACVRVISLIGPCLSVHRRLVA